MQDVDRLYPLTIRRNYKHRARITKALRELGVVEHLFPLDFFRRHWRDQQAYIEQILHLKFCTRCKVPVTYLDGALCTPCAESNRSSWQATQAMRQRIADRSLADEPVIAEDIMDHFRERNADAKIVRMMRDYEINEEDARSILAEHHSAKESKTTVNDILAKARKPT